MIVTVIYNDGNHFAVMRTNDSIGNPMTRGPACLGQTTRDCRSWTRSVRRLSGADGRVRSARTLRVPRRVKGNLTGSGLVADDFDHDGDVDLGDFGFFQGCFNGPNRPPRQAGCEQADADDDNDVDLTDYGVFQGCFNGPNRRDSLISCGN